MHIIPLHLINKEGDKMSKVILQLNTIQADANALLHQISRSSLECKRHPIF